MELRQGQICAACVPYNKNKPEWIIVRIESRLPDGNYLVKDEDADSSHDDRYTVEPSKIAQFPSLDTNYNVGDHVLALWYDEDNKDWSTMFYESVIKELKADGKVLIEFVGSSLSIQLDKTKLARFPKAHEKMTKDNATPQRQIFFTASPLDLQNVDLKKLSNEDFDKIMMPNIPIRRLKSVEGTPLLDFLNDQVLFPDVNPHITTCGSLSIPNSRRAPDKESGLLNPDNHIGRISKILFKWQ